jgi:FkbM family methyltransferase
MFSRKARTFKGKPVQSGLPGWALLLLLVVVCLVTLMTADYFMFSGQASTSTNDHSIDSKGNLLVDDRARASQRSPSQGAKVDKAVVAFSELSDSELLHERFRHEFAQLLNKKLKESSGKTPSDYETVKLLSEMYLKVGAEVNFIQVGACDGEWISSNDPIQKLMMQSSHWRGVLLEPVPYLFGKLKENVAKSQNRQSAETKSRLHLMNAALSDQNGAQDFFIVTDEFAEEKPEETHALKHQIGSFDKNHITKHLIKLYRRGELKHEVDHYITTIKVDAMTPDRVVDSFRKSGVAARDGTIDILIIDAEGFDLSVLQSFMRIADLRPAIIVYETLHLKRDQVDTAQALMEAFGYTVWPAGWNAMAVRAARVESNE